MGGCLCTPVFWRRLDTCLTCILCPFCLPIGCWSPGEESQGVSGPDGFCFGIIMGLILETTSWHNCEHWGVCHGALVASSAFLSSHGPSPFPPLLPGKIPTINHLYFKDNLGSRVLGPRWICLCSLVLLMERKPRSLIRETSQSGEGATGKALGCLRSFGPDTVLTAS